MEFFIWSFSLQNISTRVCLLKSVEKLQTKIYLNLLRKMFFDGKKIIIKKTLLDSAIYVWFIFKLKTYS